MLTRRWTPLRPHLEQYRLWTSPAKYVAVPAGRGGGKTELAKRRLVRFLPIIKPWSNPMYFFAGPTRDQAKRIAWNDLKDLVPKRWVKSISEGTLTIHSIYGSSIEVLGMDKPHRIEGVQWDGGVIDESCDQKPGVFDRNVMPACTHRDAWIWRIGVPKRQGVGAIEFKKFYEDCIAGKVENGAGFQWDSKDIIPESKWRWAMANLDAKDFNEQFRARFVNAGGGIFYSFDEEYNVRPVTYDANKPIVVGSDFNVDPMAWVVGHRYENRIEIFDEVWLRDANTPGSLKVLWQRYQDHRGGWEFYGDATGQARKTSATISDYQHIMTDKNFKVAGRSIHYPKGNPRVSDRFAASNAMLQNAEGNRRLFVDAKCEHLIDDLKARTYKPGTNEPDDSGDVGHITDALGYVVHRLFPLRIPLEIGTQTVRTT